MTSYALVEVVTLYHMRIEKCNSGKNKNKLRHALLASLVLGIRLLIPSLAADQPNAVE